MSKKNILEALEGISDAISGGGEGGSASGGGLVIPDYDIIGQPPITCNMTFSEIKEAIDAGRCVYATTNGGPVLNLFGVHADEIAFSGIQLTSNAIVQNLIIHDIENNIVMEVIEKQLPDDDAGGGDNPPK